MSKEFLDWIVDIEEWTKGDAQTTQRLCNYPQADTRNLELLAECIYSYFF